VLVLMGPFIDSEHPRVQVWVDERSATCLAKPFGVRALATLVRETLER
jgi:hypothetical protein